jgi:hypothetical protein
MRVAAQSQNSLAVETRSHSLLWMALPVAVVHGAWMFRAVMQLFGAHPLLGSSVIAIFAIAYGMLIRLCFGPLSDRITVTFSSAKFQVSIECLWFGRIRSENLISFAEIEKFEVSPPENRGFCRIHFADGKTRLLFRIGKADDFSTIRRLEEITRKKTELVM